MEEITDELVFQNIFVTYDMEHFEEDEDITPHGRNMLPVLRCRMRPVDQLRSCFPGSVFRCVVCGEHRRELVREVRQQQQRERLKNSHRNALLALRLGSWCLQTLL